MSAMHRISDIMELDGPTFFRLAYRLPAYEGASRVDITGWLEEQNEQSLIPKTEAEIRAELYENQPDASKDEEKEEDVHDPGRVQTLEELVASGPPEPVLNENVPIFEVVRCTD